MKSVQKTSDKVLILGTAPSWKKAPLGDSSWEVWGINAFWNAWGEYATRWFEIHPMSIILKDGWKYYSWLSTCPIPVYMIKHYKKVPNSIPYPINDVSNGFLRLFSSSFCYEMALAIHEKFKTIGIYGVDFSQATLRERFVEWRGLLYWIGVAMGKGINIQFPDEELNPLSHRYLYGLEYWREANDVRDQIVNSLASTIRFDGIPHGWNKARYMLNR